MSVYLDASVLVSMFVIDPLSVRAAAVLGRLRDTLVVSDLAGTEFVSALNLRMRMKLLTAREARAAVANFDGWVATVPERVQMTPQDMAVCDAYLRRFDLPLRAPDGLHIAVASRMSASLLSFDKQMAGAAKKLGVSVV